MGGQWRPGLVIGHNDAAPYNAVGGDGSLAGFIDWDMAGPVTRQWDLAFTAFSWVPLHARHVAGAGRIHRFWCPGPAVAAVPGRIRLDRDGRLGP